MMLSKRKHAMLLIGIVVLQACLCTVNAAPWRRRKLPRKLHQLRKSRANTHYAARAAQSPEQKTLYDSILKQVPGNVIELGLVMSKMLFSPFNWQKELCKDIWEKQGRRRTPTRDSVVVTPGQMERFFDTLKMLGVNLTSVLKLSYKIMTDGETWRDKYCDDAAASDN